MAYIDLMSAAGYGRFNRKLAKLTNLQTAVYWSEVLDIIGHVIKKNSFDNNGYFKVDRKYIEEKTSISIPEQYECDAILSKLEALEISTEDKDKLGIRCDVMLQLLISSDIKQLENVSKTTKAKQNKTEGKRAGIIYRLKSSLTETDPEIVKAYEDWLDVVYEKGVARVPQVKIFTETLNKYTTDKNTKLSIIKLCTSLGYREASWGIEAYNKSNPSTKSNKITAARQSVQKISTENSIDTSTKF